MPDSLSSTCDFSSLYEFSKKHEISLSEEPQFDGCIHRYCKDGTKKKDEWYIGHTFSTGYVVVLGSWTKDEKHVFRSWGQNAAPLDYDPEEIRTNYEAKIKEQYQHASEVAKIRWDQSSPCFEHRYTKTKQVKCYGIRIKDGHLIIPIYDINEKLTSLQSISETGEKYFLPGGKTGGCFFIIGDLSSYPTAYVCEGYATGASIHEATKKPVIIAFSAHQMIPVTSLLQSKYPDKVFYCAAEHGETGKKIQEKWEKEIKTTIFKPQLSEEEIKQGLTDFNDAYIKKGLDAIKIMLLPKHYPFIPLISFLQREIKPLEWCIENMIIQSGFNVILGESGIGKSRVAYSLAYSVALGFRFFGRKVAKPLKVCYVDAEMGDSEIKKYWDQMISSYHQIPKEDNFHLITSSLIYENNQDDINLYNPECRLMLDHCIDKHDFIVFDNFGSMSMSEDDFSHKASSWEPISRWIKGWTHQGKTIVLVHHLNRTGQVRGTYRMLNDPQTIIKLSKTDQIQTFNHSMAVSFDKGRHLTGEHSIPFVVEWEGKPSNPSQEPWKMHKKK